MPDAVLLDSRYFSETVRGIHHQKLFSGALGYSLRVASAAASDCFLWGGRFVIRNPYSLLMLSDMLWSHVEPFSEQNAAWYATMADC